MHRQEVRQARDAHAAPLQSERHAGAAGYSLADPTLGVLAEGDVRIFERSRAVAEDGWLVVVFSVSAARPEQREPVPVSPSGRPGHDVVWDDRDDGA